MTRASLSFFFTCMERVRTSAAARMRTTGTVVKTRLRAHARACDVRASAILANGRARPCTSESISESGASIGVTHNTCRSSSARGTRTIASPLELIREFEFEGL